MNGAEHIVAERRRQIDEKGYGPKHDAHHTDEALAWAAVVHAAPDPIFRIEIRDGLRRGAMTWREPWPHGWDRDTHLVTSRTQRIDQLAKAGALLAAEIDRLSAASHD